jgi:ABC-type transporter Mla subunit MlaD
MSDLDSALDVGVNLARAQVKALVALPGAISAVVEAANNINSTAAEARAVIRKAQSVVDRLDTMLDHVEPAVTEIAPTVQALKDAQQRLVTMTGSTEKLGSLVEDAGAGLSKLAEMSGAAGLFNRLAAAAKPTEPVVRRGLSSVPQDPAASILPPETPSEAELAELVGADDEPLDIEDAVLVEDEVPVDAGATEDKTAEVVDHPVELGSESDGPDLPDSATG